MTFRFWQHPKTTSLLQLREMKNENANGKKKENGES